MEMTQIRAIKGILSFLIGQLKPQNKTITDNFENCFNEAINEWNVSLGLKDLARNSMCNYFGDLNDLIIGNKKYFEPHRFDLLRLWAEKVKDNPICSDYLASKKSDINSANIDKIIEILDKQAKDNSFIKQTLSSLSTRGMTPIESYWGKWSTGTNVKLNYDIVLSGREAEMERVKRVCQNPSLLTIQSNSYEDAIAFVVATILKESPEEVMRTFVVENKDVYDELVEQQNVNYNIITTISANHNYSITKGHSVFYCVVPNDKITNALTLPEVNRDGFTDSLKQSGFNDLQAERLRKDSQHDTSALRRLLGINNKRFSWETSENLKIIIPVILIGSWDENNNNDKELVGKIANADYSTVGTSVSGIALHDETPFIKIGNVWKIRFPKLLVTHYFTQVPKDCIDRIKEVLDWFFEDDDPDAMAKHDSNGLFFTDNKQTFSNEFKSGLLRSITLLSIASEENGKTSYWIDDYLSDKLKGFNFQRYLSNKHNIKWIAEASPKAFLVFLENNIKQNTSLLDEIFQIQDKQYGMVSKEIYYTELLFCLENLSWDDALLLRTTELLLRFSDYKNDSNYTNTPINTLSNIYCPLMPQTHASSKQRITILKALSGKYKTQVFRLCLRLLNRIKGTAFFPSSKFEWRYSDLIDNPFKLTEITYNDIKPYTQLLLDTAELNEDNICALIELSSNNYMGAFRDELLNAVRSVIESIKGNQKVIDRLRKEIDNQVRCMNAWWNIGKDEIEKYRLLLQSIAPSDIISRNAHYFDDFHCWENETDYTEIDSNDLLEKSNRRRKEILAQIINEKGLSAVWFLSNTAKQPHFVADAFVELTNDSHYVEVYELYCNGKINTFFARRYFSRLYYKNGEVKYLDYIRVLKGKNQTKIAIVFYSPEYQKHLCDLISGYTEDVQTEYWKNVFIWIIPEDNSTSVINNLMRVQRSDDVIKMLARDGSISSEVKLSCLLIIFESNDALVLAKYGHEVSRILATIEMPQDETLQNKLFILEFYLFKSLNPYNKEKLHITTLVNSNPMYLIEIIKLLYAEDGLSNQNIEISDEGKLYAECAWNFMYNYKEVPGLREDKSIDEDFLNNYINRLLDLAKECNRTQATYSVIGKIIGNIPEVEEYPTDFMCYLVEYLDNDRVDSEINCRISNRRSFSTRSPFEGGTVERGHIATMNKYKKRAMQKSGRLVKIFDNLIREYQTMSDWEDNRAKKDDMNY